MFRPVANILIIQFNKLLFFRVLETSGESRIAIRCVVYVTDKIQFLLYLFLEYDFSAEILKNLHSKVLENIVTLFTVYF